MWILFKFCGINPALAVSSLSVSFSAMLRARIEKMVERAETTSEHQKLAAGSLSLGLCLKTNTH